MREIYVHVYTRLLKIVNKNHAAIYMDIGMTYITKIILSGIAIINTGYFDNKNDKLLLKIKLKGIAKITKGCIILFPASKPEIK